MPQLIDTPDRGTIEFPDGMSDDQIVAALQRDKAEQVRTDPLYRPTFDEFKMARAYAAEDKQPFDVGEAFNKVGAGLAGVAGLVKDLVAGGATALASSPTEGIGVVPQSLAEGFARGTTDMSLLFRPLAEKIESFATDLSPEQFTAAKLGAINQRAFPLGIDTRTTLLTTNDVPSDVRSQWDREFRDYKDQRDYDRFLATRMTEQMRELARQGKGNLLPELLGTVNQQLAEGASLFDLTDVATFGAGKLAGASQKAAGVGRKAVAETTQAGGTAAAKVGAVVEAAGEIPEKTVGRTVTAFTGSTEAGEKAAKATAAAQTTGAVAPLAGVAIPGVTPVLQAAEVAKRTGQATTKAGEAAQTIGRNLASGPSRWNVLQRLAQDELAPEWLRKSASRLESAGPALTSLGGATAAAARGAGTGALVGAGTAAVGSLGDEDAILGGLGSGLGLGGAGGLTGYVRSTPQRQRLAADADRARWWLKLNPDEQTKLAGITEADALRAADLTRLLEGVANVRYLTPDEMAKAFGSAEKGVVSDGSTTIYLNTRFKNAESLYHEAMHALDNAGLAPATSARLNKLLFDDTLPDGTAVSKGIYSDADLAAFGEQYRSRFASGNYPADLAVDAKTGRPLNPEAFRNYIQREVRADVLRNLLTGKAGESLPGLNRAGVRFFDSLLTAERDSLAGRLRAGLERVGVTFRNDGTPSDLFTQRGQPITNRPEVNALLRDYLRALTQVRKEVSPDAETPRTVLTAHDFLKNPRLAEVYPDWDGFARNPDGSIKRGADGAPVLLTEREVAKLGRRRVEQMREALRTAPDDGATGRFRERDNGAWEGRFLDDGQMAALRTLPPDLMPPKLLERIEAVNNVLRRGDGSTLIMDYNSAPAAKGQRRFWTLAPVTRKAVPFALNISKDGNFFIHTLDVGHLDAKLNRWEKDKPKRFDLWSQDRAAFLRDLNQYLDNLAHHRPGVVDLDANPAVAEGKKQVIRDLLNLPVGEDPTNPGKISTQSGRDLLLRSRRLDRINRLTPGDSRILFNQGSYYGVKGNLLPAGQSPISNLKSEAQTSPVRVALSSAPGRAGSLSYGVSPQAAARAARQQATYNFARSLPGIPEGAGIALANRFLSKAPVAALTALTAPDLGRVISALQTTGEQGALAELHRIQRARKMAPTP